MAGTLAGLARRIVTAPALSDFCLVDECVLTGGIKVGFLYREDPEPGEPHGDSGWALRGEAGDASEDDIDARDVAWVPLSAVLAVATLTGMITLTWLTLRGAARLRWLDRLDHRVLGGLLALLGVATVAFSH